MKVCSDCLRCYDDSIENCDSADHTALTPDARNGDCLQVEGYRIDSQIESGSPVELYEATHIDSGKSVLIRFIRADNEKTKLHDELQKVSLINHPNLARVFESGEHSENEIYVVLELIEGETLRERLEKSSSLAEREAIKIIRQIAEGLEKLHNEDVLHRNINPANIVFTEEGSVKLQNFDPGGIIEKAVIKEANGVAAKTELLRYFSPEQVSGREIDFRSDLYSLAVVFYEILLGRSPYASVNPRAITEYNFNESDTDRLHHDLRALIAYTLKESLQQRLNLRPRSTGNFVRQMRHLELIATPSGFTASDSSATQSENAQPTGPSKNAETTESLSVGKTKSVVPENRTEISDDKVFEDEISEAIDFITKRDESSDDSAEDESAAIVPEIEKPEPIENITFHEIEENSEEVLVEKVAEQEIYFDEYVEVEDFTEFIEVKDFEEYAETDEFESVEQTEPDEEQRKKSLSKERFIMNSFDAYAGTKSYSISKNHIYIAGIFLFILFGGIFLATTFNRHSDAASPQAESLKSQTSEEKDSEKNKTPDGDEPIVIDADRSSEATDDSVERTLPNAGKKLQKKGKNSVKKNPKPDAQDSSEKSNPANQTEPAEPENKKAKDENQDLEEKKKTKKKSDGATRPRIVSDVVIYY